MTIFHEPSRDLTPSPREDRMVQQQGNSDRPTAWHHSIGRPRLRL